MFWLGSKRGYFTDWLTQQWVQFTGRTVALDTHDWLAGPAAHTSGITSDYFETLARNENLHIQPCREPVGILPDFCLLRGKSFDPARVDPRIAHFYEHTSIYDLDAWAEWCGAFRPFGWLLATLFSRRLQQLNVPLSGLDTSRGMTNEVLRFIDPATNQLRHTAWYRRLHGTGNVLYAGFYSLCTMPGEHNPCVKVVFPLPNGNAVVIMRTAARDDGSFLITSSGKQFGEPGFYFTLRHARDLVRARYLRALQESIHVYPAENHTLRADHVLKLFGIVFLRLHYRMKCSDHSHQQDAASRQSAAAVESAVSPPSTK